MSFIVYAWIASVSLGLYAVVAKLIGKYQLTNIWQFSFFSILFAGIITSIVSVLNGATIPTEWTFIVIASLFFSIEGVLYLVALKHLDVSVMAPLFNIRVVITVLLGYFFLNEIFVLKSVILIVMIVIAGFFATMDEKFSIKSFFQPSVALGLLFMLFLPLQSIFINRAISQTNYWTTMLWVGLFAIPLTFIFLYPKFKDDLPKTKPHHYIGVLILSLFGGLGDLAAFKAFEGNIGISSVIISLPISMILAFLFSIIKPELLEKHQIKVYVVRFSAAAVMIWGALQLSK